MNYFIYCVLMIVESPSIYCCSWSPDSTHLITASRDGFVKVWKVNESSSGSGTAASVNLVAVHVMSPFGGVSVTALDLVPLCASSGTSDTVLMAVGSELGDMLVFSLDVSTFSVAQQLLNIPSLYSHGATVRKLRWRLSDPLVMAITGAYHLASVGEDNTVRIHMVSISCL
jgi:WD40 repeat protein